MGQMEKVERALFLTPVGTLFIFLKGKSKIGGEGQIKVCSLLKRLRGHRDEFGDKSITCFHTWNSWLTLQPPLDQFMRMVDTVLPDSILGTAKDTLWSPGLMELGSTIG